MIRILVDSSADYTQEELKERNIELVPIRIGIGDLEYLDNEELERNRLYEILAATNEFPKTAQAGTWEFEQIFERVKNDGDEMICILLSSALSGTYNSARLAKETIGYDKIHIVDSLTATVAIEILADQACRLRADGVASEVIADRLEELKGRTRVLAGLDTLEYLSRGGRLNKTTAAIGNTLRLKPVITVTRDGRVELIDKQIGRLRSMHSVVKRLKDIDLDSAFPIYSIYSYGTENCERFEQQLKEEGIQVCERKQIGATIGSHIGPGAFGVVFVVAPSDADRRD